MSITLGIIAGLAVMLLWGVNDFLLAIPLKKIGTNKVIFFTNAFSLIVTIIAFAFLWPAGKLHINFWEAAMLIGLAIINVVAYYNFFRAFEVGEVSIVSPIVSAYPPISVLLAIVFLGEMLTAFRIFVILIIVLGVVLASTDLRKLRHIHAVKGVREGVIAALAYGVFFFFMGMLHKTMDFLSLLIFSNLFLDTAIVIYSGFRGGIPSIRDRLFKSMLPVLIVTSVMGFSAWLLYNYGITTELVSIVTTLASMGSVVTVVLAIIFYKDKLILNQKVGIALTLLGIVLISL
jgi:drug/metabolite transporter (DMT)-like permease